MKKTYAPCIGGLPGVILDGGMWELAAKLEELPGVTAEVFPWFAWKKARDKAIRLFRAGQLDYFAPCGHSFGALKAVQAAEDVAKAGMMTRYIGAIDPTAGFEMNVPRSVEYVDEFLADSGIPAAARRRDPTGRGGGMYRYPHGTPHKIRTYQIGHIPIGSHDPVHDIIVARVKEFAR